MEARDVAVPLVGNFIDVYWPAMLFFSALKSIIARGTVAPKCCPSVLALRYRSQLSLEFSPLALCEHIPSDASNSKYSDSSRTVSKTKHKLFLLLFGN